MLEHMADGGAAKFKEEINKLTGKDFVTAYLTLLEYIKPKLARQEQEVTITTEPIRITFGKAQDE